MNAILAALCVVAAVTAAPSGTGQHEDYSEEKYALPGSIEAEIVKIPGKQYDLFVDYTNKVTLPAHVGKFAHTGLNINRADQVVNDQDLELFYWLEDDNVKFAIKRFLKWDLDGSKDIGANEIDEALKKHAPHLVVALSECQFLKSDGLEESCYADELLSYVLLSLGEEDVKKFFTEVDKDGDGSVSIEDLNKIEEEEGSNKKYKKDITFEELGGNSGTPGVDSNEFKFYVVQEALLDDFRRCRTTVNKEEGSVNFDDKCLAEELVEFTNDDVTDLDIAVLFRTIDVDNNGYITGAEISKLLPEAKIREVKEIMDILDMSSVLSTDVDYTEFRTYLRSPTVQEQMEKACTEPLEEQLLELRCMFDLFKELIDDEHEPILLDVPDVDQIITFEILDASDDGKIKSDELSKFSSVHQGYGEEQTLKRFFAEMDEDISKYICLEELNEYLDTPHMEYATGDCLLKSRQNDVANKDGGRKNCFVHEIGDTIDNIKNFEPKTFVDWFNHFDIDGDGQIEEAESAKLIEKIEGADAKFIDLFLEEVGQGGNDVNLFEWSWYVKQQELADRYEEKDEKFKALQDSLDADEIKLLNQVLVTYINGDITEYDQEELFDLLDADDDQDIEITDFPEELHDYIEKLLAQIESPVKDEDPDKKVNFREFWLWLNSPQKANPEKKIEDILETECASLEHFEELSCYVRMFRTPGKLLDK